MNSLLNDLASYIEDPSNPAAEAAMAQQLDTLDDNEFSDILVSIQLITPVKSLDSILDIMRQTSRWSAQRLGSLSRIIWLGGDEHYSTRLARFKDHIANLQPERLMAIEVIHCADKVDLACLDSYFSQNIDRFNRLISDGMSHHAMMNTIKNSALPQTLSSYFDLLMRTAEIQSKGSAQAKDKLSAFLLSGLPKNTCFLKVYAGVIEDKFGEAALDQCVSDMLGDKTQNVLELLHVMGEDRLLGQDLKNRIYDTITWSIVNPHPVDYLDKANQITLSEFPKFSEFLTSAFKDSLIYLRSKNEFAFSSGALKWMNKSLDQVTRLDAFDALFYAFDAANDGSHINSHRSEHPAYKDLLVELAAMRADAMFERYPRLDPSIRAEIGRAAYLRPGKEKNHAKFDNGGPSV